jgi:hypothetical protein
VERISNVSMHAARESEVLRSRGEDGASIANGEAKKVKYGVEMLV